MQLLLLKEMWLFLITEALVTIRGFNLSDQLGLLHDGDDVRVYNHTHATLGLSS